PSDTPVCYLCTCEQCENILSYGTCLNCNSGSGNSFTYDLIQESFDEVQIIPNPPLQCHFNVYLCQICESNSHYGYECVNPLIDHHCCYECGNSLNDLFCHQCTCEFCGNGAHVGYNFPAQVPSFQTLPSFPQQYPCCEDCGVLPEADHCQPPQYTINHPIFNAHNDLLKEKRIEEEQAAKAQNSKILTCCDDDDDYNSAITPNEPVDSLNEFIKSSVEYLVPNPSESEGESGCDVPACFTTFSNVLFDAEYEFDSKSMLNHDSSIISSSLKIDYLLDEFAGELTLLKSIPSRIDETDCYHENEIRHIKRLLYDNSSPRPPKEFVPKNSNADIESFSPSPIPAEDSDSFMEEIDLTFTPDDPMPPSIKDDDYESGRDILIHEELLDNYSLLFG
nr:hypothetical protein [Tanacetum cinerariifolium]